MKNKNKKNHMEIYIYMFLYICNKIVYIYLAWEGTQKSCDLSPASSSG